MDRLTHYRLCPASRSIRLLLGELKHEVELAEQHPWEWPPELLALNPAGELPVLQLEAGATLCGAYSISEYLEEGLDRGPTERISSPAFPGGRGQRAEVRRLVAWFHGKLEREVTGPLLEERLYSQFRNGGEAKPDLEQLRAVRANLRYHLSYVQHLTAHRTWLAGEALSFADLAAGAHLSVADYFGEIAWQGFPAAQAWYARLKSRPSFRPLLNERVPGALQPPAHYADPDF